MDKSNYMVSNQNTWLVPHVSSNLITRQDMVNQLKKVQSVALSEVLENKSEVLERVNEFNQTLQAYERVNHVFFDLREAQAYDCMERMLGKIGKVNYLTKQYNSQCKDLVKQLKKWETTQSQLDKGKNLKESVQNLVKSRVDEMMGLAQEIKDEQDGVDNYSKQIARLYQRVGLSENDEQMLHANFFEVHGGQGNYGKVHDDQLKKKLYEIVSSAPMQGVLNENQVAQLADLGIEALKSKCLMHWIYNRLNDMDVRTAFGDGYDWINKEAIKKAVDEAKQQALLIDKKNGQRAKVMQGQQQYAWVVINQVMDDLMRHDEIDENGKKIIEPIIKALDTEERRYIEEKKQESSENLSTYEQLRGALGGYKAFVANEIKKVESEESSKKSKRYRAQEEYAMSAGQLRDCLNLIKTDKLAKAYEKQAALINSIQTIEQTMRALEKNPLAQYSFSVPIVDCHKLVDQLTPVNLQEADTKKVKKGLMLARELYRLEVFLKQNGAKEASELLKQSSLYQLIDGSIDKSTRKLNVEQRIEALESFKVINMSDSFKEQMMHVKAYVVLSEHGYLTAHLGPNVLGEAMVFTSLKKAQKHLEKWGSGAVVEVSLNALNIVEQTNPKGAVEQLDSTLQLDALSALINQHLSVNPSHANGKQTEAEPSEGRESKNKGLSL